MKKQLTLTLVLFCLHLGFAQEVNQEHQSKSGKPFLWGTITKAGLEKDNYGEWFAKNYEGYQPDSEVTQQMAADLSRTEIKVFMGTWCGDSKREVPKLIKTLEASKFALDNMEIIGVARDAGVYKQGPNNEEAGLNIHRVPTVIVYKDGKEVGRIVESPKESMEEDLSNILKGTYEAKYPIVTYVNELLEFKGAKALKPRKTAKIAMEWKDQVASLSHLNTYAVVLYHANRGEEALAVLKLNCKLFPEESRAIENLAKMQERTGDTKSALSTYQKLLELKPENKNALDAIARLGE